MPDTKAPFAIPAVAPLLGVGAIAAGLLLSGGKQAELPCRFALVIPKDFQSGSKKYLSSWSQAENTIRYWFNNINAWFKSQIGKEFHVEYQTLNSQYTSTQLLGSVAPDACGSGFDINWMFSLNQELGWNTVQPYKHWYLIINGGGWAGGATTSNVPGECSGFSIIGDWGIMLAAGIQPACDPYPNEYPGATLGHEILHSMHVDPHNPVIYVPDQMTAQQKSDLLYWNTRYLA